MCEEQFVLTRWIFVQRFWLAFKQMKASNKLKHVYLESTTLSPDTFQSPGAKNTHHIFVAAIEPN